MTFSTAMYFGRLRTPWVTIQANVDPSAFDRNYVKLQFGAGNSTYSVGTVFLLVQATKVVGIELESQIHSERTGDGAKSNNDVESSGSIGRNPGHRHYNTVPAGTPLGLPQPSTASILLLDSPLPSPGLSISTLYTAAEVITPLALPSPKLPVPRSPHTPQARPQRCFLTAPPSSPGLGQGRATRSLKRKIGFEEELRYPRKRRRLE
ncbi:hypothetical protein F5Y14DRAFT_394997 [Nemania sp. NC0429]|nr:hypothetical protein F5Y14DRAFT_394997 [Nemania sp. NC0429]